MATGKGLNEAKAAEKQMFTAGCQEAASEV